MKLTRSHTMLLAALLALAPAPAAALHQDALSATPSLPEARRLLDRFVEVTRARELVEKTDSMHVTGTFSLAGGQMEGPIQIWYQKPSQQRTQVEIGMVGTMLQGCDGKVAWETNPMMGGRLLEGVELLQAVREARYDARLKGSELYESMRTVAKSSFDGKECYEVELVLKPLPGMDPQETLESRTLHEFYEVESGLLAGLVVHVESDMFSGAVTTFYREYRSFGGYPMASRTVVQAGPQEMQITAEAVEFDTVEGTLFTRPTDIEVLLEKQAAKAQK